MSKQDNDLGKLLGNFLNEENFQKVKNLINDEKTMNTVMAFASQMSSNLINCDFLNQILDGNPNITDELITEQIDLFKEDHPNSKTIIDKYLQSYQEKRSNKSVYNIRQFLKSGQCKKALDDPQVQQYLNEILNSPEFKEKFQQLLKENINKRS